MLSFLETGVHVSVILQRRNYWIASWHQSKLTVSVGFLHAHKHHGHERDHCSLAS
jgi:hypothetical protein